MNLALQMAAFLLLFSYAAAAQLGGPGMRPPSTTSSSAFDPTQVDLWFNNHEAEKRHGQLESPSESVSKLDLKAPVAARREYGRGLQLLMRKDFTGAAVHLEKSTSIYPDFVAAHNALGSAYMDLGRNEQARAEFFRAVELDDHLPNSYLNLGRAELALGHYPSAEQSIQKASSIAPLDVHLLTALTYAEFLNRNYQGTIATAHQVHELKHEGAAVVHYFAAASWQGEGNLPETKRELQTLLDEDPTSPAAEQARKIIDQIDQQAKLPASPPLAIAYGGAPGEAQPNGALPEQFREHLQNLRQQEEVTEAESECTTCGVAVPSGEIAGNAAGGSNATRATGQPAVGSWTIHSSVDEVSVLFAATDHRRAVSDLNRQDVDIRDDQKAPAAILGFRNYSELPLRLGLLIDTSASITSRFAFEQRAASKFLQKVVTGKDDLAFVVGFSNSVLLVQDLTRDEKKISHGIGQLAPAGGTAAWDAVAFAVDKVASRAEARPVAKILVIISDGDDNSSSATLKEAIARAEQEEVLVYAVSTRDGDSANVKELAGNRALEVLAGRTGGAAFFPGSLGQLDHSLDDLQQVIRSRYLISYKPAMFKRDGRFRTIDIIAKKSDRRLRVFARKGYYAPTN